MGEILCRLGRKKADVRGVADSRQSDVQTAVFHLRLERAVVEVEDDLVDGFALRLLECQGETQGDVEFLHVHLGFWQVVERRNGYSVSVRLRGHENGDDDSPVLQGLGVGPGGSIGSIDRAVDAEGRRGEVNDFPWTGTKNGPLQTVQVGCAQRVAQRHHVHRRSVGQAFAGVDVAGEESGCPSHKHSPEGRLSCIKLGFALEIFVHEIDESCLRSRIDVGYL